MDNKGSIGREMLKSNIMKSIMFKFDYYGVIDIKDTIKEFTNSFGTYFDFFEEQNENYWNDENSIEEISNTLAIPKTEIETQTFYRFKSTKFANNPIAFDISKYCTILRVECENYTNIDPYIDFLSKYFKLFFDINKYLRLQRADLRKIGSKIYLNHYEIFDDFEQKYFDFEIESDYYNLKTLRKIETYTVKEFDLNIVHARIFDTGLYFDEEKQDELPAYRIILDIGGYMDGESLIKHEYAKNMSDLLKRINDQYLFDIFKKSVTMEFLKKNI